MPAILALDKERLRPFVLSRSRTRGALTLGKAEALLVRTIFLEDISFDALALPVDMVDALSAS
jgi:hypothetical protein